MCIQRHPCKYKCFQNYSELYSQFPITRVNPQTAQNYIDCGCGNIQQTYNYGFKQNCYNNCQKPIMSICPQKKNKFCFSLHGIMKIDGFY